MTVNHGDHSRRRFSSPLDMDELKKLVTSITEKLMGGVVSS